MDRALELADLWSALHRRQRLFWGVTMAIVGVGVASAMFVPAKYESRAVVVIGQLSQLTQLDSSALSAVPIEPAGVLVQRLNHQYRLDDDYDTPGPRLVSVTGNVRDAKEVIVLRARARTAAEAQSFLGQVISTSIVSNHSSIYEAFVAQQSSRIAHFMKDITKLAAETDRLKQASRSIARADSATSTLAIIERARLISEQSRLEAQSAALQISLLIPYSEPTRILLQPTLAERSSQPRPFLYIGLGLLIAPLLGILLVVATEVGGRK